MYKEAKKRIYCVATAITLSLLCGSGAQADGLNKTEFKPVISIQNPSYAPYANVPNIIERPHIAINWLRPVGFTTRLHLTPNGLAPLPNETFTNISAPATLKSMTDMPETMAFLDGTVAGKAPIITGSVSAAIVTTSAQLRQTIKLDRPLFGAHRIRFGKIKSGARISGMIRKAAASGPSAICIHECANLADTLSLHGSDIVAQLRHVSASVNKLVTYRTDEDNYGRLDQWATPNETLSRKSGDCEDYAILKMALLSRLGVPVTAMEIVVLKDTKRRLFHAVLSVALEGKSVILDNMTDEVKSDTDDPNYAPLFSISGNANYIFGYKGGKSNLLASIKGLNSVAPGAGF